MQFTENFYWFSFALHNSGQTEPSGIEDKHPLAPITDFLQGIPLQRMYDT